MDWPLLTPSLIKYAAEYHGDTEIVSRTVEGPIHRHTYRDAYARTKKLANALQRLGVGEGLYELLEAERVTITAGATN
ncbi:MAG: hypothetical protein ACE5GT_00925 [Rhodospirillales bacterium]